jgi:hypothetical protein
VAIVMESGVKLVVILGTSESKALLTYADREGMKPREAAHKLLVEEMARGERQIRCPCCDGRGRVDAET